MADIQVSTIDPNGKLIKQVLEQTHSTQDEIKDLLERLVKLSEDITD